MKSLIHQLASMKIAVVLLTVILIAMAIGTVVESIHGTEAAGRTVYYSAWFQVLLVLFALNILCSLIDLWPWGRQRIGFVLTHGSMLLILAGALVTDQFKIEGKLALWEGEESTVFETGGQQGGGTLPFAVRLDAFEIDYYQGTRRPAMFRSRVTVTKPSGGRSFPAVIEMNRELNYGGYRFFQSSYQQTPDRDQTILTVSRDPGQPVVFAGYILLMIGMTTVLLTRVAQRRALERAAARAESPKVRRAAAAMVGLLLASLVPGLAGAATVLDPETVDQLRRLPVQHDGRVMPLDTLAREAARKVTGGETWDGIDPVALVLGWTLDPNSWADTRLVRVGKAELIDAIGMSHGSKFASYRQLTQNPHLMELIRQARAESDRERPLGALLEQAQKMEGRLVWMQGFLQKRAIKPVPVPEDPVGAWSPPADLGSSADLIAVLNAGVAAPFATPQAIDREITYNLVSPGSLSWWILSVATVAALFAWARPRPWLDIVAMTGLVAGFGVMTWGLAVRWQVAGRIPASNMYESLLFLGWGVGLFAVVALVFIRNRLVVLNATFMSALTMALADLLPIDPFIHPMPPVLSGTAWLAIHVPIIMLSYSVLALGVVAAHMQIGVEIFAPDRRDLSFRMNDLLYWYMHVGSILLIAGILTGSIWAASSWGRYWGWDPKEVWSLIAFLAYLAILHGRFDRWIGTFGVAAFSIVAFWTILMTYIGVNFVLTAGLHSYGFGGSGVVRWMAIVAAIEALFLAVGFLAHSTSRKRVMAPA